MDFCQFEPSRKAILSWLSCRQNDLFIAGTQIPSLLGKKRNISDSIWFIIALLGELITWFTFSILLLKYDIKTYDIDGIEIVDTQPNLLLLLLFLIIIFCDFFFAIRLHRNVGEKRRRKCEFNLINNNNPSAVNIAQFNYGMQFDINNERFVDLLYKLGLIFIAFIKITGLFLSGIFYTFLFYLPVVIVHFVVAYIHIKHTGYFLAQKTTNKLIKEEYKVYIDKGLNAAQARIQHFTTRNKLYLPIKNKCHEIVETDLNSTGYYTYELIVQGLLTDEDIIGLIVAQSPENKIEIFKVCREFQLAYFY